MSIVVPYGMFGVSDDDALGVAMRKIALLLDPEDQDWSSKYGANFENDEFLMHRSCWCDEDNCPWCAGCTCPQTAFHYLVDKKEVTFDEWMAFFVEQVGPYSDNMESHNARMKRADAINKRRTERHERICDHCQGKGIFAEYGGSPGKGAPNFWHKLSGFKVWWYKFIGRSMEIEGTLPENLVALCAQSLREKQPL